MTPSTQNEKFNASIQAAIAQPAQANLILLGQQLDLILSQLPQDVWLSVAGDAIAQFAEICAARAELLLEDWQSRHSPTDKSLTEPVLTDELLSGILRHTMSLNLETLLEETDPQHRNRPPSPNDSVVGDVDKHTVLDMLDQMESKQHALQIAYEESISEWTSMVRQWVEAQPQPVDLETLLTQIGLSPVKAWLGLLLASPGFRWEHQWRTDEEFYLPQNVRVLVH